MDGGDVLNNQQEAVQIEDKHHSDSLHNRHTIITLLVIGILTLSTAATIYVLYEAAFEREKARLNEIVTTQARLINAIARSDETLSNRDQPDFGYQSTLSQVIEAHRDQTELGQTGEFMLAKRSARNIAFLLPSRHTADSKIPLVSVTGHYAEPMRKALSGYSGTLVGLDYRGVKVLAAHIPLKEMGLGLVAKIDLTEIRKPFFQATINSVLIVALIIAAGLIPLRHFQKLSTKERKHLEVQLRQAQKLEAVGQLAAGIAHEINTPTQFVGDNIQFLKDAHQELEGLNKKYNELLNAISANDEFAPLKTDIQDYKDEIDLDFLLTDINEATDQAHEGTARIATIVKAMKAFSHPGSSDKESIDLNQAIESTITVARNEWKYVANLQTDFDPDLPFVYCLPGEFNQTILNMVVNSAHAIETQQKKTGNSELGQINVTTTHQGSNALITVSDNGCGIPKEHLQKIYDPFFTTKAVGKGTGQGLSIAYSVIKDKHGGDLHVESTPGKGTTFQITLPIHA